MSESAENVSEPSRSSGSAPSLSVTVNQLALQPAIDGLPEAVLTTAPLLSASTVTDTELRSWWPSLGLVTVYATVSVPEPGYSGPPVVPSLATLHADEVPTVADPDAVPFAAVKAANAPPAMPRTSPADAATATAFLPLKSFIP